MRTLIKIIFAIFALSHLSCTERCDGESYKFRVRLELTLQKSDTITLKYLSRNGSSFWNTKTIFISGDDQRQFIELCFPEEPIDFKFCMIGQNKNFAIHSVLFENQQRQKFIKEDKINLYFAPNKTLEYQKANRLYKSINNHKVNSSSPPCLMSRTPLRKLLGKKLVENNTYE